MLRWIKQYKERKAKERKEFRELVDRYKVVFGSGQRIWDAIMDLEERKIDIIKTYDGKIDTSRMWHTTIEFQWRKFNFSLTRIPVDHIFAEDKVRNQVAIELGVEFRNDEIFHNLWSPSWFFNGTLVVGIDRITNLTDIMISDFYRMENHDKNAANRLADAIICKDGQNIIEHENHDHQGESQCQNKVTPTPTN